MNLRIRLVFAAFGSLVIGGCAVIPNSYQVRPTAFYATQSRDVVCIKTRYFEPCTPIRRDDLRVMHAWRTILGE